ncbi:MAG: hypothetical protein AAF171_14385 [Cyanobacteria bacterium P01_A01_bin.116]
MRRTLTFILVKAGDVLDIRLCAPPSERLMRSPLHHTRQSFCDSKDIENVE